MVVDHFGNSVLRPPRQYSMRQSRGSNRIAGGGGCGGGCGCGGGMVVVVMVAEFMMEIMLSFRSATKAARRIFVWREDADWN